MKRLSALILSLLLFWVQVFVVAQPLPAKAAKQCCGCACPKADCCVTRAPTAPSPLPAAAVQTGPQHLNLISLSASIAWLLPRNAADFGSAFPSPSLLAAHVPLFRRDCALLI